MVKDGVDEEKQDMLCDIYKKQEVDGRTEE